MTDLSEMRRVAEENLRREEANRDDPDGPRWEPHFPAATILALLDAAALLEKTIYRVEGYTGPPVWWDTEAREILSRLESL